MQGYQTLACFFGALQYIKIVQIENWIQLEAMKVGDAELNVGFVIYSMRNGAD
jgi:hypothetical protein